MSLNTYQRSAVRHRQGAALAIAGPGAGKTRVIVERVADLLREGLRPERILCVTFAKDAAEEMRKRIAAITGLSEKALAASVSTFHSLALRILQASGERPAVLTSTQVDRILREFVRKDRIAAQRHYNAKMRRNLITPDRAFCDSRTEEEAGLAEVYGKYDETLREDNAIDFDSMVYRAVEYLIDERLLLGEMQQRFRHVIVDECHDSSYDQMTLAKILAANGSLMTIFDPSQQIFGWRGADAAALLNSANGAARYFLPVNYRSHSEIIEAFKPFAETDELSQELVIKMDAARGDGGKVELHKFADDFSEAEAVCDEIRNSALPYQHHAVLTRTKALLLFYCEELERLQIPYEWRGRNFWASPEVEDAIAFCRLAIDPSDRAAWRQAICSPAACSKYLGRKFAAAVAASSVAPVKLGQPQGEWRDYEIRQWRELRDTVKSLEKISSAEPHDFLRGMRVSTGLGFSGADNEEPDDFRGENLDALIRRAEKFNTVLELVHHAERMKRRDKKSAAKGVILSTIHSAKGLEWPQVFVVGLKHEILPHKRSEDFNEERRLVYVALSRARDRLWMSYHGEKSVFVNYLPKSIAEVAHGFAAEKAVTA